MILVLSKDLNNYFFNQQQIVGCKFYVAFSNEFSIAKPIAYI
jgi:hypothetical protein